MDRDIRKKARKRVKAIKGFYVHGFIYAVMGAFFFLMNIVTDPWEMWFYFPMIPWGTALAFHYLAVFGIPGTNLLSKEWEEREYEKQLEKLEGGYSYSPHEDDEERYLDYRELSQTEVLELRRMQAKGEKYFDDDTV